MSTNKYYYENANEPSDNFTGTQEECENWRKGRNIKHLTVMEISNVTNKPKTINEMLISEQPNKD